MWIIPNNHPLSCHCAQDTEDSKSVLEQSLENAPLSLMWRSKPSPLRTWLTRWKRENWIRYLSGRILKPLMLNPFEDALISSLAAIRASRSALPEKEKRKKTRATCGHSSEQLSYMPDQDKFFSKMYWDIYQEGSPKSSKIWKAWVTQLRLEYSQRLKSAQLIKGNECLSWPTPTICWNHNKNGASKKSGDGLSTAVKNWGTPRVTTNGGCPSPQCTGKGSRLEDQVSMCPTPAARDYKNVGAQGSYQERKKSHAQPLPEVVINGQLQEDATNGNGKNQGLWGTPVTNDDGKTPEAHLEMKKRMGERDGTNSNRTAITSLTVQTKELHGNKEKLNPNWVSQLMGLPIEWTALDYSEME